MERIKEAIKTPKNPIQAEQSSLSRNIRIPSIKSTDPLLKSILSCGAPLKKLLPLCLSLLPAYCGYVWIL